MATLSQRLRPGELARPSGSHKHVAWQDGNQEHGGLSGVLRAVVEAHGVRPDCRVLQFASAGFDA